MKIKTKHMSSLGRLTHIQCTERNCDAVVHVTKFEIKERASGQGATMKLRCEEGHDSLLEMEDHSASLHLILTNPAREAARPPRKPGIFKYK